MSRCHGAHTCWRCEPLPNTRANRTIARVGAFGALLGLACLVGVVLVLGYAALYLAVTAVL